MSAGASGNLPGVAESESPDRIIVHIDMDCFYAACERLREPALRGEPVVIGMGYDEADPHGAVATASYEAREFGVESAMPISEALELLPRRTDVDEIDVPQAETGYYRPVDMEFYESVSTEVQAILETHADTFEPVSIDEAYLDVTSRTEWDAVTEFARAIKQEITDDVGVTASVGVAPTKSAAKVASDQDKPDGLVVVQPGTVAEFFAPLDVEDVHGIGPVTAGDLRSMGIETAGNLANADPARLEDAFGSRGREFYERAQGNDPRPVSPPDDPKSLSREQSVGDPITAIDEKREVVRTLAHAVAERATNKNALYRTVGIKVVTPPFDVHTRAHSLSGPVDDPELVERIAIDLLEEFAEPAVRKLGVRVSNLSFSEREQVDLDQWDGATIDDESVDAGSPVTPDPPAAEPVGDLRIELDDGWQLTFAAFTD